MSCMSYAWLADPKEIHDLDHYVLDVHWSEKEFLLSYHMFQYLPQFSLFASVGILLFIVLYHPHLQLHLNLLYINFTAYK